MPAKRESRMKSSFENNQSLEVDDSGELSLVSTKRVKAEAAKEERRNLSRNETQRVRLLRSITLLALLFTASLVSAGVWYVARNSQKHTFESGFENHASKIISSFHDHVGQYLASLDAFSSEITAFALLSESTFPNITLPNFEVLGASTRVLSQTPLVFYSPFVTDAERAGWEDYAKNNQLHLMTSFMKETGFKTAQDIKYGYVDQGNRRGLQLASVGAEYREEIWGSEGIGETEAPNSGPYYPMWQMSPTLPLIGLLNFNTRDLGIFRGPLDEVLESGSAALGPMHDLKDETDEYNAVQAIFNATLAMGQFRHKRETFQHDPVSVIAYPVFTSFSLEDREVGGFLVTMTYWRLMLQHILPEDAKGFVVVVCNRQCETYELNGPDVRGIGVGDLHDPHFDDMAIEVNIADYLVDSESTESMSFTAASLNTTYVACNLTVYPSQTAEAVYVNSDPIVYAVVVGGFFLLITFMFLMYNWLVEQRQNIVLDKAARSTAVVKSMFPENVQERLYEETNDHTEETYKNNLGDSSEHNGNRLAFGQIVESGLQTKPASSSQPIADLFPQCTVLFADLVGFTKWSSNRTPSQVFGLLETIYSNFDAIAARRGVFKVETIGDCYVAITGCPNAQADHAVIMARYAWSLLTKLHQLLGKLVSEYGEDSNELQMRVGLHSGPVTAGVLRGARSRFQLFGDTVNVAARMESTGIPGRVQCSQTTVDELIMAGKESWVRPRESTVVAKGKGEMQTYFIVWTRSGKNCGSIGLNDMEMSTTGSSVSKDSIS